MADAKQIEKLTELARKAWPDRDAVVRVSDDPEECGACVLLQPEGEWEQQLGVSHPNGLNALEAALLVLCGEPSSRQRALAEVAALRSEPAWDASGERFDAVSASDLELLLAKLHGEP